MRIAKRLPSSGICQMIEFRKSGMSKIATLTSQNRDTDISLIGLRRPLDAVEVSER
jgi:hypothetical protein